MTDQIIDVLFLPLALFGATLVLILALVLRNTVQLGILNRRQRLLFDLIEAGGTERPAAAPAAPPSVQPAAAAPVAPSAEILDLSTELAVAPRTAPRGLQPPPANPPADPVDREVAAGGTPIEPITVRSDRDLGVVYSFRGKDYLSRVAADQARWRALNQSDGTAHARARAIRGPAHRGDD